MNRLLIKDGWIVTMDSERRVFFGDVLIENERIKKLSSTPLNILDATIINAKNQFVLPGFIQAHTHLCQALFRGEADDLELLDWLKKKIWPMEAAHTPTSVEASANIALLEMQLLGTTSILDMGTVHHTDQLFAAAIKSGIRYFGGKCLMDLKTTSGPLFESKISALRETETLIETWHRKTPLLDYVLCPRFAVSCSESLMKECLRLQAKHSLLIHIHASENRGEIDMIKKRTGRNNIDYLDDLGLLNKKTVVIHGVHLRPNEIKKMVQSQTGLVHCPSSNLKLASGIAPIEFYRQQGMKLAIGADGAPCNNTMDPFLEMRLTALLQKPRFGPRALPAQTALELMTLGGARVLGRDHDIGSLEEGKLADIITVDRSHPSVASVTNPYSALVYSSSGRDVCNVITHGRMIVCNGVHQAFDRDRVVQKARSELKSLIRRL